MSAIPRHIPEMPVESFAALLRGDTTYASASDRNDAFRSSELIAAAAYDYCRVLGFSTAATSSAATSDHEATCARYIAMQLREDGYSVPQRALGLPPFIISLLWGAFTRLLVDMIWRAAELLIEQLSKKGAQK